MNDSHIPNQTLPLLPLRDVVVFPHMVIPLFVGRQRSIKALEAAMEAGKSIMLVAQKNGSKDDPTASDIYGIGCVSNILQLLKLPDGTVKVLIEGVSRARIANVETEGEYFSCELDDIHDEDSVSPEVEALRRTILSQFEHYVKLNKKVPSEILASLSGIEDAGRLADTIAAHLPIRIEQKQEVLETLPVGERLEKLLAQIENELDILQVEKRIRGRVKRQMEKSQREYYLNEQVKAIQKELGEGEDGADFEDIEKKIKAARMPEEARKKCEGEFRKLRLMSPMSAEATVVRNYIDTLLALPWKKKSKLNNDLAHAEKVLDEDHYGLEKVKERILEYLAVQQRVDKVKAPILCLVGPPGVGKTSLGQSIARATNRKFVRMALGGVRDEAEIRGHRRTYIGSLPGKIVQKLCKLGSNNPLILLDEIDKIGMDHRGDPASALLEVLDPAQNNAFSDHYLETDIDLSGVLFIATANTLNIPAPLLDRMEVIRLPGYTSREKSEIATRYILPRQIREHGLRKDEFALEDGVVTDIIEDYTREAGVRNLEREIGKLARKSVRKLLTSDIKNIAISKSNLEDFLGVPKYRRSEDDLRNKIGCVTGLAWTSVGGETLQIEATIFRGKGKLNLTGQLGDVMKESIQAASSVVRSYLEANLPELRYDEYDIHMHLPEGATPKDGPSAGIGMATALLSAFSKIPVRGDLAMTGEITLHGRVLAIGGLKEKLLAAVRSHIKTVLIPEENRKDLREIPDEVKDSLTIIPVSRIEQVFEHAFEPSETPLNQRLLQNKQPPPISTEAGKNIRC